jgi:hypothetical protein
MFSFCSCPVNRDFGDDERLARAWRYAARPLLTQSGECLIGCGRSDADPKTAGECPDFSEEAMDLSTSGQYESKNFMRARNVE